MRVIRRTLAALTALPVLFAVGACTDTTDGLDPEAARVTVLLTDAPANVFESAVVEIGAVELVLGDGEGPVQVTDYAGEFDLLDLQNGVTAALGTLEIEPGFYRQLRLHVLDAEVTLHDTLYFRDGEQTKKLKIPSGAQSGIKINLGYGSGDGDSVESGIDIVPGETIIVVDFDVSQNFRLQGSLKGAGGFHGVIFTPMLRATVVDVAASISGVVSDVDTGDPIEGATVRGLLQSTDVPPELETPDVTALTDVDGVYKLWYLAPGTYEVSVDDFTADPQTVTVGVAEDVEDIDFSGTF
jgi:hypothetical protein